MKKLFFLSFLFVFVFISDSRSDFRFEEFDRGDDLLLLGSAEIMNQAIRLTPNLKGKVGVVWHPDKQNVADEFRVRFQYQITGPYNDHGPCDGVSFVIQNTSNREIGSDGGGQGYQGIPNCLAVEVQTFVFHHISVQTKGTEPNRSGDEHSIGRTGRIPKISDGNVHVIEVKYKPGTMWISMDNEQVLTVPVDLDQLLRLDSGKAWIGLSSATGGGYANHDVLSWSYREGPFASYELVDLGDTCAAIVLRNEFPIRGGEIGLVSNKSRIIPFSVEPGADFPGSSEDFLANLDSQADCSEIEYAPQGTTISWLNEGTGALLQPENTNY